jgi:threonine synthase
MSYVERAADILADFLGDFTRDEIEACVKAAYGSNFAHEKVAPVVKLGDSIRMLELWHGPTCAFKDMALQLLPHLLTRSLQKTGGGGSRDSCGEPLRADKNGQGPALECSSAERAGAPSSSYFYPDGGVSEVQYLQIGHPKRAKTWACAAWRGNF